jgi:hypothetical protein
MPPTGLGLDGGCADKESVESHSQRVGLCEGLFLVRAYTSKYESRVEHVANSVWLGPARPSWNRMNVEIELPLPGEQLR